MAKTHDSPRQDTYHLFRSPIVGHALATAMGDFCLAPKLDA
jgi:hypothetical protein